VGEGTARGHITLAATERGGAVEVSVTDSGPGIPDDDLPEGERPGRDLCAR
jgi:signal transduction histidine kinase